MVKKKKEDSKKNKHSTDAIDKDGREAKRRKLDLDTSMVRDEEDSDNEGEGEEGDEEVTGEEDEVEEEEVEAEEDEQEELEDMTDPFEKHFNNPDAKALAKAIEAAKRNEWTTTKFLQPVGDVGKMIVSIPAEGGEEAVAHVEYVGKRVLKSMGELKVHSHHHPPPLYITE